jgi:hypothetical protein
MADAKGTPTPTPVVETEKVTPAQVPTPAPVAAPTTPVVEAEKTAPIAAPSHPPINKELSHKDKIAAFVESRKGAGKVKLNDFLKSLFPLAKGNEKPDFTVQGNMKKLKLDLIQLRNEGRISFVGSSFEQLGKAFFPDQTTGKTAYYDISNLTIEIEA